MVFRSRAQARLFGSEPHPLAEPRRLLPSHPVPHPDRQRKTENWQAAIISGALTRVGARTGEIEFPDRTGRTIRCSWRYIPIPADDEPDFHLFVYEPLDGRPDAPETAVSRVLRMEEALFEIQAVVDGVGLGGLRRESPEPVGLASLTNRELDVVNLLLEGNSNERIAKALHVSLHTVKSHMQSIFRKLDVASRAELLARFVKRAVPNGGETFPRSTRGPERSGPTTAP